MYIEEELYKAFLEEMNALEMFRMTYASLHESQSLDSEDPDIRRLIEALALFSARARLAGSKNIKATRLKIFKQFFSYLITPVPSMGILYARINARLTEPTSLPQGTEIAVSTEDGRTAIFTTLTSLRILPIYLNDVSMISLSTRGYRFLLEFYSPFPRKESIEEISLHINYLNNFEASLKIQSLLKECLTNISVSFDKKIDETSLGQKCQVTFGQIPSKEKSPAIFNPLEKERLFFHFPWQELFMTVSMLDTATTWNRLYLYLDVNSAWPRSLVLSKDMLQPFAVPIINLRQFNAEPIICDGLKEKYLIRYPDQDYGFELHSIRGVYEITKEGLVPLVPESLSFSNNSFDIEDSNRKTKDSIKLHYIKLNMPEAFKNPKTISVDAFWFQPWFSTLLSHKLSVNLFTRNISGVDWELHPDLVPHFRNPFLEDMEACLNLITLVHKSILSKEDIIEILTALGISKNNRFTKACELLEDVKVQKTAYGTKGVGQIKYIYWLRFSEYESSMYPIIKLFTLHLQNILDTWISNAIVEVKIEGIDKNNISSSME